MNLFVFLHHCIEAYDYWEKKGFIIKENLILLVLFIFFFIYIVVSETKKAKKQD
jgi:hypothetical protein